MERDARLCAQKIKSVAILKCLGATTVQVLATYVAQVALLGLAGSVTGVLIAAAAIRLIPASLLASFGGVAYGLTASAARRGSRSACSCPSSSHWCRCSRFVASSPCCSCGQAGPLDRKARWRGSEDCAAFSIRGLVAGCRSGGCYCRVGRRGVLAGGLAPRRLDSLGRLCRGHTRALWSGVAARPGGAAARQRQVVSLAACRPRAGASRQPDAGHSPLCGPWLLLRARRARATAKPHRRVGDRGAPGIGGHVPDRHPVRSVGRDQDHARQPAGGRDASATGTDASSPSHRRARH